MTIAMGIVCLVAMAFGIGMMPHHGKNSNIEQTTTATVETNSTEEVFTEKNQ